MSSHTPNRSSASPVRGEVFSSEDALRVTELFDEYEIALDSGQPVTCEELCQEAPHLLPLLLQRIRSYGRLEYLRHSEGNAQPPTPDLPNHEFVREIDRGGLGVVSLLRHQTLDRHIAVKVIPLSPFDASARKHFERQIAVVRRFQHASVCDVTDCDTFEHSGSPFGWIAMEFLSGGPIDHFARKTQPSIARMLNWFLQIVQALDAAASAQILHCDIKPANILMTRGNAPKVTDFGLASIADEQTPPGEAGRSRGTVRFLAPELIESREQLPAVTSEIYSLGITFQDVLAARFENGPTEEGLPEATGSWKHVSEAGRDLHSVIARMTATEVAHRYPSYYPLLRDLHNLCQGRPVSARPVSVGNRLVRTTRRNPSLTLACVAVLLLVIFQVRQYVSSHRTLSAMNTQLQEQNTRLHETSTVLKRAFASSRLRDTQRTMQTSPQLAFDRLSDAERFPQEYRTFAWRWLQQRGDTGTIDHSALGFGPMTRLQFSPDEEYLLVMSRPSRLSIVQLETSTKIDVPAEVAIAAGVAFFKDAKRCLVPSTDERLLEVELSTGRVLRADPVPELIQAMICLSDDEQSVYGISRTGEIFRRFQGQRILSPLALPRKAAGLWLSPQGTVNVVDRGGQWVQLSPESLEPVARPRNVIREFIDADSPPTSLLRSACCVRHPTLGACLGLICRNGTFCLVNLQENRVILKLPTSPWATHVDTTDTSLIIPDHERGQVVSLASPHQQNALVRPPGSVSAVAWSHTRERVAVGTKAGLLLTMRPSVALQGVARVRPTHHWPDLGFGPVFRTFLIDDGNRQVFCFREGWMATVDCSTGETLEMCQIRNAPVGDAAVAPDNHLLAFGFRTPQAGVSVLRCLPQQRVSRPLIDQTEYPLGEPPACLWSSALDSNVVALCFDDAQSTLFVAERNGGVMALESTTGQPKWRRSAEASTARGNAMAAADQQLWVGQSDGMVKVLDVKTGQELQQFRCGSSRITAIAIDPDRNLIGLASRDGNLSFRRRDGALIRTVPAHDDAALSLAIHADGTVASGGADSKVVLSDYLTGEIQLQFSDHAAPVTDVHFDGDRLFTTSLEGPTIIYHARPPAADNR
ncbi:MAG: protein kinase [Planctomycetaceae bacterium]|nr:protein kinase [Planctomycetaceae bacterium]